MKPVCRVIRQGTVYAEKGKFAGWPANSGLWSWGNELLVGFTLADHEEKPCGHPYAGATSRQKFARSLDGGETWAMEDAYAQGITAEARDHVLGSDAVPPHTCPGGFRFDADGFAMTLRRTDDAAGTSHFYVSSDRGRRWRGPYAFPNLGNPGILARTDYLVEDRHTLLAFLTASKRNGREGRVGCARTRDGGRTWQWVAWLDAEPEGFAIMPATVRLSPSRLVCVVRRREQGRNWLAGYVSDDNAESWRRTADPVADTGRSGNPAALVKTGDGRLCLGYAVRGGGRTDPSRICVRFSEDAGEHWSGEVLLRGCDGAHWDVGYPCMARRPDGRLVLIYYYNHAWTETPSYRYIAATHVEVFNPCNFNAQ